MSDNGMFYDSYNKTNLRPADARIMIVPRLKTRFGIVSTQQFRNEYQKSTTLLPYINPGLIKTMKVNTYIDLSPGIHIMRSKIKQFYKEMSVTNFDYMLNQLPTEGKTIGLVIIDTDKPLFADFKQSIIGLLMFYLRKKKKLPFSQVMLGFVGSKGTMYTKIYDEAKGSRNTYQRILSIYKKGMLQNMDKFSLTKTVASIIKEKLDIEPEKATSLASAISQNTNNETIIELITNEEETSSTSTANEPVIMNLSKETKKVVNKPTITSVATKLAQKLTGHTVTKTIKNSELQKAEISTLKKDLPSSKTIDFTKNNITTVKEKNLEIPKFTPGTNIYKGLILKESTRPFKTKELKNLLESIAPSTLTVSEINETVDESNPEVNKINIKFTTKDKKTIEANFKIPRINKQGVFEIYKNKYMISKQLSLLPITKYKNNEVNASSLLYFFKLIKKTRDFKYYMLFNSKLRVPFILYLGAITDLREVVTKLKGKFIEKDGSITITKSNDLLKELFIADKYPLDKEFYISQLNKLVGNKLLVYFLTKDIPAKFLDIRTRSLMKVSLKGKVNTFVEFLLVMFIKLLKEKPAAPNDFRTRYINTTDNVYKIILSELNTAMTRADFDITSKKPVDKIKINENFLITKIFQTCDRVEDSPNPLAEISHLNRITYSGYGTFSSEDAPKTLRDINETHKGIVDPIKTSKGSGVGNQLYLTTNPNLISDNNLLEPNYDSDNYLTYSTKLVPFLESSATARLNMGCAHSDQSAPIIGREAPIIQSGLEDSFINLSSNKFKTISPVDGVVTHISRDYILLKKTNGEKMKIRLFNENLETSTGLFLLNVHTPTVKEGQHVKKGNIIAENYSFKNGTLSLGRNALCAFSFYNSSTFEDGIVMSEESTKKFMIQQVNKYKIELNVQQDIINTLNINIGSLKQGDLLLDVNTSNALVNSYTPGSFKLYAKKSDTYLLKVKIIVKSKTQAKHLVMYLSNKKEILEKIEIIENPKYTINEATIIFDTLSYKEAGIGDKIANKHGNKGVINHIIPKDKTAYIKEDGRKIDMFINPIGLFNRANWGQMKELMMSAILYEMTKIFLKRNKKFGKDNAISWFSENVGKLTKVKNYDKIVKTYLKSLGKIRYANLIKQIEDSNKPIIPVVIPPFKSITYQELLEISKKMKLVKTVIIPELNKEVQILVGYIYFMRLIHTPETKINARSTGVYTYKTHQPVAGRKNEGGQRVDEMTTWGLLAHDSKNLVSEIKTVLSDDLATKNHIIDSILNNKEASIESIKKSTISESVYKSLLLGLHIKL